MWLVTKTGFFSVVKKPGDSALTVRSRVRSDLEELRRYVPELGEVRATSGRDYQYRATVSHEALAKGVARMVLDLDYSNFKREIAQSAGHKRANIYGGVWGDLMALETLDKGREPEER